MRGLVPEAGVAEFLGGVFGEVMRVIGAQGLHPDGMPFGCYVPTPDGLQVEAGFPTSAPVEPAGRVVPSSLPVGPAIQVLHQGPYSAVAAAYRATEAWLVDNNWEATGPRTNVATGAEVRVVRRRAAESHVRSGIRSPRANGRTHESRHPWRAELRPRCRLACASAGTGQRRWRGSNLAGCVWTRRLSVLTCGRMSAGRSGRLVSRLLVDAVNGGVCAVSLNSIAERPGSRCRR